MGTYDTIGGTPRHDPAFDKDEFVACLECAKANGYTEEEAYHCNAGDLQCKGCPWLEDMREELIALEKAFWAEQEKKEKACYDQIYEECIKTEEGKKRLERLRKYEGEKRRNDI